MTQVREAMSGPVVTIDHNAAASDAARMMRENDTGDVVVTDAGKVVGILTDRDLAIRVVAAAIDPEVPIREVHSADPVTIAPDEELSAASELMRQNAIRRLPVCEGDNVVGFISLGDLATQGATATDADATLSDISAAPPNR